MSLTLERGTAVIAGPEVLPEDDLAWSKLLEEADGEESFWESFAKTALHNEPSHVDVDAWFMQLWGQVTPLTEEASQFGSFTIFRPEQKMPGPGPVAEMVNADRLTLLARKYAMSDKFSTEGDARLSILTERLRRLIPAVTEKEVEFLEEVAGELDRISESENEIRRRLDAD